MILDCRRVTVRYLRDILRSALSHAWGNDLVAENVAKKVTVPELVKKEIVPMTPAQAMSLLGVLRSDRLLAFYSVAIALGLRPAEAIGLRWSDVDLDERWLAVRQTIQRIRTHLARSAASAADSWWTRPKQRPAPA